LVLFLALPPTISSLALSASNFITLHPELINELAGHALVHNLYSHMHSSKRGGLSRRMKRKNANVRRRWFVDNIILHHKRLHDKNRELSVSRIREQALAKRDALKNQQSLSLQRATQSLKKDDTKRWREMVELKERSNNISGRIDNRRLRARSRWLSVSEASES